MGRHSGVTVRTPAKINLGLSVGPLRDDGYHDLLTVFQAVSLYEDLSAEPSDDFSLDVSTPSIGIDLSTVPVDDRNLALRAARALAGHCGVQRGARLSLTKRVPVAGGLAGGSADAAAALVACDALWRTGLSRSELMDIGATLGADVPFCLLGATAVGTGRGDRLTSVLARHGQYHWVLAVSEHQLSTPSVYGELDRLRGRRHVPEPAVNDELMQALRRADPVALGQHLHNDLQDAALELCPDLEKVLDVGHSAGALGGIVSGSGPTVAFLASTPESALDICVALQTTGSVVDTLRVHGPVHGARLVDPLCREHG